MTTISIAQNFSDAPWGRYPADGKFCGQNFRDDLLVPALRRADRVTVNLDGVEGLGSSFLDEAFGGLVRKQYFTASDLEKRLVISTSESDYDMYVDLIWRYIREASQRLVAA